MWRRGAAGLTVGAAIGLVLAACGPSAAPAPGPTVDETAAVFDRLHEQTAEVAERQAGSDPTLAAALRAIRGVDEFIIGMRDPARIDDVRTGFTAVDAAFAPVVLADVRPQLIELAFVADDARATLAVARDEVPSDWERAYLDAEDGVLAAVRDYAEVADRLAQVLDRHWPTYTQVRAETAAFLEQRWFYRTSREAADAFELRIQPLLEPLATAQIEIADIRAQREGAAQAVNAASAVARRAWSDRPPVNEPSTSVG